MAKDAAYRQAEQKIQQAKNHPRILTTNSRTRAVTIRAFVAQFVDGLSPKGGSYGA